MPLGGVSAPDGEQRGDHGLRPDGPRPARGAGVPPEHVQENPEERVLPPPELLCPLASEDTNEDTLIVSLSPLVEARAATATKSKIRTPRC